MAIFLKIVQRAPDGTLHSPTAAVDMIVEYRPGYRAMSDFGPIFVYGSLETAARRARRIQGAREPGVIEVWHCVAHNPREIDQALTFLTAEHADQVVRWWAGLSADVRARPAFAGELVADWAILYRRVLWQTSET